ncbi:MAG: ABC transporter permease [Solirubrobacteraceae bacterium]|nr:MAG: ABC transporter permease [Solirubrobacterales bacterium]
MTTYLWELRKLRHQKRTMLGLFGVIAPSVIFGIDLAARSGTPNDIAFGPALRQTGLAFPLVLLFFGAFWLFPLVTSLVAGDIVASEYQRGTLKTILTRSVGRSRVFWSKVLATLTYTVLAMIVMTIAAVIVGSIVSGLSPITDLSGKPVGVGRGLLLVFGATTVYLIPLLAIAAFGIYLSTATRTSAAAVVGALMLTFLLRLIEILPGLHGVHPYLITTQFDAWMGLLRNPIDWAPIGHAAWVCALWILPFLAASWWTFKHRDVTA